MRLSFDSFELEPMNSGPSSKTNELKEKLRHDLEIYAENREHHDKFYTDAQTVTVDDHFVASIINLVLAKREIVSSLQN